MTAFIQEAEAIDACRALFGDQVYLGRDFLKYLQVSGAKAAFRRQAKETHPDLFGHEDPETRRRRAELFRDLVRAYDLLTVYLRQREQVPPPPPQGAFRRPSEEGGGQSSGERAGHRGKGSHNGHRYRGPLPSRHLQIGIYLYYRGVVPYQALIDALVWQRRQRPNLGDIAIRWGWLNDGAIRHIFGARQQSGRFGEKAVRLGFLQPFQVQALLHYQRSLQKKLGHFFVEQGYLSRREMDVLAAELQAHNARWSAQPF